MVLNRNFLGSGAVQAVISQFRQEPYARRSS
jgi:hypothetical protein